MENHIPQIIWISLAAFEVFYSMIHHGESKDSKHNGGVSLISIALMAGLLYWGGFFSG